MQIVLGTLGFGAIGGVATYASMGSVDHDVPRVHHSAAEHAEELEALREGPWYRRRGQ